MTDGRRNSQSTTRLHIRAFEPADSGFLTARGLTQSSEQTVLIAEHGGQSSGAIAFVASPFESAVLGFSMAKVVFFESWRAPDQTLKALLDHGIDWLHETGHDFVSARIDQRAETTSAVIDVLQSCDFRIVECLLTLQLSLTPDQTELPGGVEIASVIDADECAEMASRLFVTDRFHADPRIADAAADRLKQEWVRNSCRGRADKVFIVRRNGKIVGFNACNLVAERAAIDLIGTAAEVRGQGLGRRLVDAASSYYAGRAKTLVVGTQSSNQASLALYQSAGFQIVASALTLHREMKEQQ